MFKLMKLLSTPTIQRSSNVITTSMYFGEHKSNDLEFFGISLGSLLADLFFNKLYPLQHGSARQSGAYVVGALDRLPPSRHASTHTLLPSPLSALPFEAQFIPQKHEGKQKQYQGRLSCFGSSSDNRVEGSDTSDADFAA